MCELRECNTFWFFTSRDIFAGGNTFFSFLGSDSH